MVPRVTTAGAVLWVNELKKLVVRQVAPQA
jgi:hypothetical protein